MKLAIAILLLTAMVIGQASQSTKSGASKRAKPVALTLAISGMT